MEAMPPSPDTLPNYHFLLIAPNLGAEWFFDASRVYWERFRPTVVSDLELILLIPVQYSVAITVIARRDTASQWGVWIAQTTPAALFDPLVFDSFDEAKVTLNERTASNQPFGVPLAPTPTPAFLVSPTPGPLIGGPAPTRAPGGFITQTPTPPYEGTPQQPIEPTPGPITGG
jgi:hypothetical protein